MKKRKREKNVMKWLHHEINKVTMGLLAVLKGHCVLDCAESKRETIVFIHIMALINAFKTVNCPILTLEGPEDIANMLAYQRFANEECHKLMAICETLSSWKPDPNSSACPESGVQRKKSQADIAQNN